MATKTFIKWENLNMVWEDIKRSDGFMVWEDIALIEEVARILRGGGPSQYEYWVKNNPWKKIIKEIGEEKTDKFIKIFCQVNGMDYNEVRKIKENKIKLSVDNFEKVFKKINIKIDFKK